MIGNIFINLSEIELKELIKSTMLEVFKEIPFKTQLDAEDKVMTVKEAAAFLNLSVPTMYAKTSQRLIPHFKTGNKLYFNKKELKEWAYYNKINMISTDVENILENSRQIKNRRNK